MKITKYPQSCLLVETKGKKILIDPGTLKYKEENFDVWNNVAGNSSFVLKVLLICICSPFSKNFFLV